MRPKVAGARAGIAVALAGALLLPVGGASPPMDKEAGGAFTCDFGVPLTFLSDSTFPGLIERDRMYMAERPGMQFKHIPLRVDAVAQELQAGGRYLFDTRQHAEQYFDWVRNDFVLDGIHFLDRSYFLHPDCHAWGVVGARELGPLRSAQVMVRTERFAVPDANPIPELRAAWPTLLHEAEQRGLTGVWLLVQQREHLVSVVYFADRTLPSNPLVPDVAGLAALELAPPLGRVVEQPGWQRIFDRTHWVLTIWFPYRFADRGEASLWPASPPLPAPFAGDTVCEPSRGETNSTAPQDCALHCGDGIAQREEGETTRNCPSDVRLS